MRLHPIGSRVLVRPIAPAEETASGLTLVMERGPDVLGEVVAIGEAVDEVLVGETVIFPGWVGQELRWDDERFILLDAPDLAGVVTADPVECPYCRRPLHQTPDAAQLSAGFQEALHG